MPIATRVVGNGRVGAILAARNMPTEGRHAAALDGSHHLHLVVAQVSVHGATPCRTMVAEDVRNLQSWTGHWCRRLLRRLVLLGPEGLQPIKWAHHFADDVGCHARVECGGIQLGVPEKHLDDAHIDFFFQEMGRKTMP